MNIELAIKQEIDAATTEKRICIVKPSTAFFFFSDAVHVKKKLFASSLRCLNCTSTETSTLTYVRAM